MPLPIDPSLAASDDFQLVIKTLAGAFNVYHNLIDVWFLVFARVIAFISSAPIWGRKDIPFNIKVSIAIAFTILMMITIKPGPLVMDNNVTVYLLLLAINAVVGYTLGFIADTILMTINASGSVMNNQMGLSAAMTFDPSTRQQVTIIEKLFGFIALMAFYHMGGAYLLIDALHRSFDIFPLYVINQDFASKLDWEYLINITGNTLTLAVQLVAPVMMITLLVDLTLGIVNRTAQQIQVFQLSFALKPSIGAATLLFTLPFFFQMIQMFLSDYARIY